MVKPVYPTELPFFVPTDPVYPPRPISPPEPYQFLDGSGSSLSSYGSPSTYSPISPIYGGRYFADNTTTPGNANKPPEEENGEGEAQLKEKPREVPRTYNVRNFTQEEREIYNKIVVESDGFDCPYVPPEVVVPGGLLRPVNLEGITDAITNGSWDEEYTNTLKEELKGLDDMVALALKDYNQQSGKLYQFVKVVKACKSWGGGGSTNNITFQAKEDTPGSAPQKFQACVFRFLDNTKVSFCRLEELRKPPTGPKETSQ